MKNVTLDTNCIIDLEEERKAASCIRALIQKHEEDRIELRVVAIGASERKPDGTYASHFNEFKQKIAAIGLGGIEILKPMAYWGATFWDWGLWTNDEMVAFERQIHEILFPEIEFEYEEYFRIRGLDINDEVVDRKWRNAKCDVLGLWSHIHYQGGIFVTSDANFQKQTKKTRSHFPGCWRNLNSPGGHGQIEITSALTSFPRSCVGRAVRKTKRVLGNAHSALCVTES